MKNTYNILSKSIILLSLLVLTFSSLSSSDQDKIVFSQIRELIDKNRISQAQEALKPLLESDPDDPTLNLYQTEIWIIQGEENYHSGNLKTAYEYFTKAQTTWASHPTVRSRIAELQGKKLVDRPKNELKLKTSRSISPEIQNKGNVIVLADPEILELTNQLKTELRNRIAELGQESSGLVYKNESSIFNNKIFFIFVGISLLSNLILSLLLFRRR